MNGLAQFLALLAVDLAGLVALWFILRARIRRYLELENLLDGVREEARALVMELNETADRNVSLVEDRILALRSVMDEADRRIGVARRERESRETEREVFDRLRRRRPIVPESDEPINLELRPTLELRSSPLQGGVPDAVSAAIEAQAPRLDLAAARELPSREPPARALPEIVVAAEPVQPRRSLRDEALDLYRKGFSADIIAARLGATVSEIELLVDLEERRAEFDPPASRSRPEGM